MTISSGGFNPPTTSPSFSPTPTIYEQQTTGIEKQRNEGATSSKGTVVILPDTTLLPMSQIAYRTAYNGYKSEAGRPSLPPVGQLRGNAPERGLKDDGWKAHYEEFVSQLPSILQEELKRMRLEGIDTFKEALEILSHAASWVESTETLNRSETTQNRQKVNAQFVPGGYASASDAASELLEAMKGNLGAIGPNAPYYDESMGFANELQALLKEVR